MNDQNHNQKNHNQEYKWEIEVYMEMWSLCFTPCTFCFDLDLSEEA